MRVGDYADRISLLLVSNRATTNDPVANEVLLTGQVGGRIYYNDVIRLEDGKATLELSKLKFPGGILQLTAFSGRENRLQNGLYMLSQ